MEMERENVADCVELERIEDIAELSTAKTVMVCWRLISSIGEMSG